MAVRSKLAVSKLDEFKAWLAADGWTLEEPRDYYEVLRARKPGKKYPLIVWRRSDNEGGGELTHLTYADRDQTIVGAFLRDQRKKKEEIKHEG